MDRSERLRRLRNMLGQVMPDQALESAGSAFESLRKDTPDDQTAAEGLKKLSHNESIDETHRDALEAIVMPRFRPVVDVINNSFAAPPSPWQSLGSGPSKASIEAAIPSVGRIELPNHPQLPYGGTGFVVGDGLLMTNRHVAELFASGLGAGDRVTFRTGQTAEIDFKREILPDPQPIPVKIVKVLMIHPYWDMALLKVAGLPAGHSALKLSVDPADKLGERDVAVLGYPAQDFRNDLDLQNRIFRGVYNVKRMTPGKLKPRRKIESFGHEVSALTHDASTLGGSSGSVVVDVATGQALALHFAGIYLDANFCVPTYELARDPRVVDAGVNFTGKAEPPGEWMGVWKQVLENVSDSTSTTTISGKPTVDDHKTTVSSTVAVPTAPASATTGISIAGGGVTFTIPLNITISLGGPALAPAVSVAQAAAAPTVEALFGRKPAYVPSPFQGEFDPASLAVPPTPPTFHTHLSMALASHLAYAEGPTVESTGLNVWGLKTCESVIVNSTRCFVATTEKAAFVAFRGTSDLANWLTNLNVLSTAQTYGTVHRGFLNAFKDVADLLQQRLEDFRDLPLYITGHSLGGALATIAAAEWLTKYKIAGIHTFGQPAVGKSDFRTFISNNYPDSFHRFVNNDDIVPRVPPGYVHVGKLYHFDAAGNLPAGFEAVGEALPAAAAEPKVMSDSEFNDLKKQLRTTQATTAATGNSEAVAAANLEGFFPSFSDHSLDRYVEKVRRQI